MIEIGLLRLRNLWHQEWQVLFILNLILIRERTLIASVARTQIELTFDEREGVRVDVVDDERIAGEHGSIGLARRRLGQCIGGIPTAAKVGNRRRIRATKGINLSKTRVAAVLQQIRRVRPIPNTQTHRARALIERALFRSHHLSLQVGNLSREIPQRLVRLLEFRLKGIIKVGHHEIGERSIPHRHRE